MELERLAACLPPLPPAEVVCILASAIQGRQELRAAEQLRQEELELVRRLADELRRPTPVVTYQARWQWVRAAWNYGLLVFACLLWPQPWVWECWATVRAVGAAGLLLVAVRGLVRFCRTS